MFAPSDETNHRSSRRKFMFVSASVTPATDRSSESIFKRSARFCSTDVVNGSTLNGEVQSAIAGFSGASRTSCCLTRADALAMATALMAVVSIASLLRPSDAAKPHAPSAITRTPMPSDSASEALPILPFFVASARLRSAPMRTSAYLAPRNAAVSRAHAAMCFIVEIQFNIATQLTPCDPLAFTISLHAIKKLAGHFARKVRGLSFPRDHFGRADHARR